jgi:hypothetical protein
MRMLPRKRSFTLQPAGQGSDAATTPTNSSASEEAAADSPAVDPMLAAFLVRSNSMANTLFTLVKFASTYLGHAPTDEGYPATGSSGSDSVPTTAGTDNVDYTRPRHYDAVQKREPSEIDPSLDALRDYVQSLNSKLTDLRQLVENTAAKLRTPSITWLHNAGKPPLPKTTLIGLMMLKTHLLMWKTQNVTVTMVLRLLLLRNCSTGDSCIRLCKPTAARLEANILRQALPLLVM